MLLCRGWWTCGMRKLCRALSPAGFGVALIVMVVDAG